MLPTAVRSSSNSTLKPSIALESDCGSNVIVLEGSVVQKVSWLSFVSSHDFMATLSVVLMVLFPEIFIFNLLIVVLIPFVRFALFKRRVPSPSNETDPVPPFPSPRISF